MNTPTMALAVLGVTGLALVLGVWGLHAWRGGRADRAALVDRLADVPAAERHAVPFMRPRPAGPAHRLG